MKLQVGMPPRLNGNIIRILYFILHLLVHSLIPARTSSKVPQVLVKTVTSLARLRSRDAALHSVRYDRRRPPIIKYLIFILYDG